ncbi:YopX family protein [Listeria monocytogenes]|uniref:YopX family protein n=2 Tax=Listeria monocytogenes TaxID=1639 RepID=UPI0017537EB8|nr:YopX family protein [Listeria monocytogenes]MCI2549243.1 hypothetical protein [Listeria monocytogenes]HAA5581805.1 hypothetical protein [Listeria monocytogenes]HAA9371939.1 hypothetical protein [Listeria monocytogenes]HBJ9258719.1 hypothetical protein [Listeria monocytogenes]HBJ9753212.1 hypothetical protein [Listeria monocytogenes]
MREIEFRGKRIDNGEWVYGNLMQFEDSATFIFADERKGASTLTYAHFIINNMHAIDEKTIGQYTGLKDKNGKKIFEGDIVTAFSNINKYTDSFAGDVEPTFCLTPIVYDGACFKTTYKGEPSYVLNQNVSSLVKHMEVIGNIHENPELMEGTE